MRDGLSDCWSTRPSAILGQAPEYVPIDEDHPTNPKSPYGLEKLTGDRYTRLYAELYGLPTVSLRYFNIYGPRQTGSISIRELAAVVRSVSGADVEIAHEDGRIGDIEQSRAAVERLSETLGFTPSVGVSAGLSRVLSATHR